MKPTTFSANKAPWQLLFWGSISAKNIQLHIRPDLLCRNSDSEKYIDHEWSKQIAAGLASRPGDTVPHRHHFGGLEQHVRFITVLADPAISYQDVIGSRPDAFRKLFSKIYWPTPITVSTALIVENKRGEPLLMITVRSESSDSKAGGFHATTGGAIDIDSDLTPWAAAVRETEEESGIMPTELKNALCHAVIYNPYLSEVSIKFVSFVTITAEEIQSRHHDSENEIVFIPLTQKVLEQWLLTATHATSVDGVIGMILAGQYVFGEQWSKRMLLAVKKRFQGYSGHRHRIMLEKTDMEKFKYLLESSIKF